MHLNLLHLESGSRFEEFCQILLKEDMPSLVSLSPPDLGMDAYDPESRTIFQAYFPERSPRKDKIADDLRKASAQASVCNRWVLLLPKNPTAGLCQWLRKQQPNYPFSLVVWGRTEILTLLQKHRRVRETYFPTELRKELHRLVKGKRPKPGDAGPGQELNEEEREELREWIIELVEAAAKRKRRGAMPADYGREYGELNAHFDLSSFDRLPAPRFAEAREYLERKHYARRAGETQRDKRNRLVSGIKAIQKDLRIGDESYRALLTRLTGKTSTTQMSAKELLLVYKHFQHQQALVHSAGG